MIFRKDTTEVSARPGRGDRAELELDVHIHISIQDARDIYWQVIAVHIIGLHAADLIQECSNAISAGSTLKDLAMMVHTHPTLCEVLDEAFKGGLGRAAH